MEQETGRPGLIKKIILSTLVTLLLLVGLWHMHQNQSAAHKEPWITIFVHGNFGSLMGFVSFSDVLNDKVSGTLYRQVNKSMRSDDFFFRDQIILQRGLIRIQPTFDIASIGNKKYAAYPSIKAYDVINQLATQKHELNYFYTFGWSGLMSQKSRRFEAIRLYNALSEELEKFHKQGIYPKIRIIAHSHGGNLCLNLAAVQHIINVATWNEQQQFSIDEDANDSIQKTLILMKGLPTKEIAKTKNDQKIYDYVPVNKSLTIDELLIFGTPIQPETESFCYAPIFAKVFNFYSGEDFVQKIDWVSSKKASSSQIISKKQPTNSRTMLFQVKIMTDHTITHTQELQNVNKPVAINQTTKPEPNIWDEILAGRNIFTRATKDPTHKELWFIVWRENERPFTPTENAKQETTFHSFIKPLPVVILAPLFTQIITQQPIISNAQLNLYASEKEIYIAATPLSSASTYRSIKIPRESITDMQKKVMPWKPDDLTWETEFKTVYKHVTQSQSLLNK